jgi:alcohol dehydrogenase, propanol-preferring
LHSYRAAQVPETVLSAVLEAPGSPLVLRERARPVLGEHEIRIEVGACGVCRTDLHIRDGELTKANHPLVLGHEIVGQVLEGGERFAPGARVGVPWLAWACGTCDACRAGRENLCERAVFTGYTKDGGYSRETVADERFCFPIDVDRPDHEVAPLLCAGLIGYRSLRFAGDATRLGLYGFGAAAHIVAQVAVAQRRRVFAFTRRGDDDAQQFALRLGAVWAGPSDEAPPEPLDAAIIFAPAGELVPVALLRVRRGGRVVCGGIHMSDIPAFPYELLWGERTVCSVANLTRADGDEFLELLKTVDVQTSVERFTLDEAEIALDRLRMGAVRGAAVLEISPARSTR